MPFSEAKLLEVKSRKQWREWLHRNCASTSEIWLIFWKPGAKEKGIDYEAAVEEAICFGWIDSLVKRIDDYRYARKFTPRKEGSKWSSANRKRYAEVAAKGLLAEPGKALAPTDRDGDAPRPAAVPEYIEKALKMHELAWQHFEKLAPSYRRAYVGWVDSAKRDETKQRRLQEVIGRLAAGKKPGLK